MSKTSTVFNLNTWLSDLKAGDKVKIGGCTRRDGCKCEAYNVVGETNEPEPCIVVDYNCKMRYFAKANGRELGGRKRTYKEDSIAPYTEEDAKHDTKVAEEKDFTTRKQAVLDSIGRRLSLGRLTNYGQPYISHGQGIPIYKLERIDKVLSELTGDFPLHPLEK